MSKWKSTDEDGKSLVRVPETRNDVETEGENADRLASGPCACYGLREDAKSHQTTGDQGSSVF